MRRPRLIIGGCSDANVAELVDAPDLGSGGVTRASSSLAFRTTAHLDRFTTFKRIDMQVSVENTGKLERRMQVQVPAERVSKEIAARLKQLSRTARLNGFRPGKAPITVIRQQFGPQVHREVIGELMQSSFSEAVTQNQLAPAGSPRIEPQSMDEGQDLTYVATFEVFPEVALQPMDSLEIERVTAEVTESDIDAMIERLRKQQMKYAAVSRPAAAGDKVTVDFDGRDRRRAVRRRQGRERRHRARRRADAAAARGRA